MKNTATLLISSPDRKGLVAAIADFLYKHNANILHADQHQDATEGIFLMRVEWDLADFTLSLADFPAAFDKAMADFDMNWQLVDGRKRTRMAIFVSKFDHCLVDLLYRHKQGELQCDIPLIISNHEDTREIADFYGIPYHVVSVTAENKVEAEAEQFRLLAEYNINLIVLARYMQVLSSEFCKQYPQQIINIHHSFLPAFHGARPYHRAFERGVKLIGATGHYVTEILDDGPIIEQNVTRISHRDSIDDLLQKGRDLERVVLSSAVRWHIDHRVLVYKNKTVVFD
ncbi:formyltetrahydrofolate deformylase [Leeia sp. TBRC 13508]|uniref:Formyltetrahydrofolate deformylase n=1 Tax=Leeia speluncae TaxID=2884804 RepID=A0ABS8DAI1_9NEIS|nr:formyltetrahydrofolate deformylase [Leeia speluncae]MCB6185210.1 formyltetrahydrofolate deformylase [Leeia speluncae]